MKTVKLPWVFPLFVIVVLTGIMSFRLLSDPDLGSHLKGGKWITENLHVPQTDISTYTVRDHEYIDIHWLFQVSVFGLYSIGGYKLLSVLVTLLSLVFFYLFYTRNRIAGVPLPVTCLVLLSAFLIIEPRLMLRPELVSYILISLQLILFDRYFRKGIRQFYLLPLIMLVWCNIQGLFILGLFVSGICFLSAWITSRKFDLNFAIWAFVSLMVCFINPYFIRGFMFPLELFTRFDSENIFHTHIKELKSFASLDAFTLKEILFILFAVITFLAGALTWRKRKIHEVMLGVAFLYLALVGIRNIPLFIIVAAPMMAESLHLLFQRYAEKGNPRFRHVTAIMVYILLMIIPAGLAARMLTDAYYPETRSYNKTGWGLDDGHQPEKAATFLLANKLDGKIINSMAAGAWFAWRLKQPVFIDARLEVIKEPLYEEVIDSWHSGLPSLIDKYKPDLIVYNYSKYYPWTLQLVNLPAWRLIYIDGLMSIFAREGYAPEIPLLDIRGLAGKYHVDLSMSGSEKTVLLDRRFPSAFLSWVEGFYKKREYASGDLVNMASFFLMTGNDSAAEPFFLESLRQAQLSNVSIYYALAEIYRRKGEKSNELTCYCKILQDDPENAVINQAVSDANTLLSGSPSGNIAIPDSLNAVRFFNEANRFYNERKISDAENMYTRSIRLNPRYAKAYNNLGILQAIELKQYREAAGNFDKAIALDPGYADAWLGRGTCKFYQKDFKGAHADWKKAASLGSRQAASLLIEHFSDRE